jgi:hypothetical protein
MFHLAGLLSRFSRPSSHWTPKSAIRHRQSAIRARRLFLESLESRRVLSTFTVVNTDDSGFGSLRQAILDSEANSGPDLIDFNIPGSGVHTIAPLTALPNVSEVTIDGTTQLDYAADGLHPIELSGEYVPWVQTGDWRVGGLTLLGTATVKGLTINRFFYGIVVNGSHNHIEGNYIGLDPTGTSVPAMGQVNNMPVNMNDGFVFQGADHTLLGGSTPQQRNVIAGCAIGVNLDPPHWQSEQNQIAGNYIGTDPTGRFAVPNTIGVSLGGLNNLLGTNGDGVDDEAERNIISGNSVQGVALGGSSNVIAGNYIGTDATGMYAIANPVFGVRGGGYRGSITGNLISGNGQGINPAGYNVLVQGNMIGTDKTGETALPNEIGIFLQGLFTPVLIGGATPEARNYITGNGTGIRMNVDSVIQGNYIGRTPGSVDLGNGHGIVQDASGGSSLVGGRLPGQGNVISGNSHGVSLQLNSEGVDHIEGNLIVHNGHGVDISNGSFNQVIGGTDAGAGNTIAFNGVGVVLSRAVGGQPPHPSYPYAKQNRIVGNSIFGNQGLGIDLSDGGGNDPDGVTLNDTLDSDTGSNEFQNFPELTAASSGATTHVQGSLHSTPSSTFTLDFYASSTVDPSGYGEGERWLGSASVVTDANGNAAFDTVVPGMSSAGEFITSTATDAVGNTSEFSQAVQSILGVKTVTVDIQPEALNVDSNGTLTVVIFGAADFDAGQIDVSTVHFAGAAVWQSSLVDANGDGRLDMQVKFRVQDTALEELYAQLLVDDHDADGILDSTRQTAQVEVTGQTLDEALFSGSDNINLFLAGRSLRNLLDELFG